MTSLETLGYNPVTMTDDDVWDAINADAYDRLADKMVTHLATAPSRVGVVQHALELAGSPDSALVVEAACGDGRDAEQAITSNLLVARYVGYDPAEKAIELARGRSYEAAKSRQYPPEISFDVGSAHTFEYPEQPADVILSFNGLLHVSPDRMPMVFERAASALAADGIMYVITKGIEHAPFEPQIYQDDFDGERAARLFFDYSLDTLVELAAEGSMVPVEGEAVQGPTEPGKNWGWMNVAFRQA
jgi:ubiquinone/menaquinone biosynthesis C-methylase UbiE